MTSEKALELLPSLKAELGDLANGVKDYNLIKFLRWKADVGRTAERYRGLVQWRKDNPFGMDEPPLQASRDPRLKRVLESSVIVAPEGMVDKEGHTVIVGRLRNNDMSINSVHDVVRMAVYTIDRVLEREDAQKNGVVVFHDMRGLSRNNLHPAIPKMLISAIIGHFPIRIKGIFILDAPFFFRGLFRVVSLLMPAKLRARTHFVNDINEIYAVIDQDQLLEEHGGKRKHDSIQWVDSQIQRELNGTMQSLRDCSVH